MRWIEPLPLGAIAALAVGAVLVALELGYQLSRRVPVDENPASEITASILAIVGLLLAFSFSMADDRHAARHAAAVREANSIGTFWLRTSLLPAPQRSEAQAQLRRYVDLHVEHRRVERDPARAEVLEAEMARRQGALWALIAEDARREPEASRVRLLVPSLNALIDDQATVLAAKENQLPNAIFVYLSLLVVVGGFVVGYRPRSERRSLVLWASFTIVVTGVLVLLVDLDRPRGGWIQTDLAPYLRLRESLARAPA